MGAGTKVLLLGAVLATAAGATLWLVREPDAARETSPPAVAGASTRVAATPTRPVRQERARKAAAKPVEEDALAPTKHASDEVRILGEVVDSEERPVAGALVRATRPEGRADETKTDAAGRFALRVGRRPSTGVVSVGVTATSGPAHAAFAAYELGADAPDEDEFGAVQLAICAPLVARVEDAAGPVVGAGVYVGSFFGTVFASATTDASGVARFDASPLEDGWLFAHAKGRGRARGEIPARRDSAVPLVLTLTARTVRVLVVRTPPDEPLVGERVAARLATTVDGRTLYSEFVPPVVLAPTDAEGATRLEDVALDDGVEARRLRGGNEAATWRFTGLGRAFAEADARQTELRIEVPSGRTIRWRVLAGDVAPPPEGALVRLRAASGALPDGPSALRVEGGELVGSGFGPSEVDAVAEAADGAIARIVATRKSERGSDTTFHRPRRVEVVLLEERGGPVAGAEIALYGRGRLGDPGVTDGAGRVVFDGIEAGEGRVSATAKSQRPPDERGIGTTDVTKGDGRIEARLPAPRRVVLRVTTEGRRALPPERLLTVDQRRDDAAEWDEAAAEVRFTARPRAAEAPLAATLRCEGFRDASVSVPPGVDAVDVALDRGGTLLFEVIPSPAVKPLVELQYWTESMKRWRTAPGERRRDDDGGLRFVRLAPGRYRLFDATSRIAGAPVDVAVADAPSTRLDLSAAGLVTGRVVGPDDKPVAGAWVDAEDLGWNDLAFDGGPGPKSRASCNAGAFTVIVPGDRAVRLRAAHPFYKADPEKGVVEVTAPTAGLVLRLVEGPTIEFTIRPNEGRPAVQGARVLLFAEGDDPIGTPMVLFENGRFRAGGFEPGRAALLLVDPLNAAPIVLADVDLKDGSNDLGELRPTRGSTIRVRAAAAIESLLPVQAWKKGRPVYVRYGRVSGQGESSIDGLGPGRFEIRISGPAAEKLDPAPRIVDVDGERDVVIDWPGR